MPAEALARVARAWDREYARGRYRGERALPFADDVLAAARARGIADGLYVGCGNGRNYLALAEGGLRLVGLDVSATAIAQLAARAPQHAAELVVGDLDALADGRVFGLVAGIQVFQHGDRATAHAHIRRAQERVAPGGLMAVRANATATVVERRHELLEGSAEAGFSVRYLEGPKQGLDVHFFAQAELAALFAVGFEPLLAPRLSTTQRAAPEQGTWSQWEGIWARR